MGITLVTGSGGLVGSAAVRSFAADSERVVGIDNDMRSALFGSDASTAWSTDALLETVPVYEHHDVDIRDETALTRIFGRYGRSIDRIIHAAAQPSHDWAARDPRTDFSINATGTLNLLEAMRHHCPDAVFVFCSTNKVYGDRPNSLPLIELETRWDLDPGHAWAGRGIPETMSVDASMHSLFGASKLAADILVQEYGRYFSLRCAAFRGGCLTGPGHSGTELHGFLAYLMRCTVTGTPYRIFGYGGKQVRDNIHAHDLVAAFRAFCDDPRSGEVYNIGGGVDVNCSMLEAIALCEEIAGRPLDWTHVDDNRIGDHMWYVSDLAKFRSHFPGWELRYDLRGILEDIWVTGAHALDVTPTGRRTPPLGRSVEDSRGRLAPALLLLLTLDLVFLSLHLPQVIDLTRAVQTLPAWAEEVVFDRRWWLEMDGGHAERYGYVKTVGTAALAAHLCWRTRQPVYAAWTAVLLTILLDDALQLHEWGGVLLAGGTSLAEAGGPDTARGELITWSLLGAPLLAVLVAAHRRSDQRARDTSTSIGLLTTLLIGFAVVLDAVHSRMAGTWAWVAGTIEDGGELVVITAMFLTLFAAALAERRTSSCCPGSQPSSSRTTPDDGGS